MAARPHVEKKRKNKQPYLLANALVLAFLRRPIKPSNIFYRTYAIYFWRHCRSVKSRLKVLYLFLFSPFIQFRKILRLSKTINERKTSETVPAKMRLYDIFKLFRLCLGYSIDVEDYYLQGFDDKDGSQRAKKFVNEKAFKNGIYRVLTLYGQYLEKPFVTCSLGKKLEFYNYCIKYGIKTVPVYFEYCSDGSINSHARTGQTLPDEDLFIKYNVDNQGRGAEAWCFNNGYYWNIENISLNKSQLEKRLFDLAKNHQSGSVLVQPLILPHPEMAQFRRNASPTLRIITVVDVDKTIHVGLAMLRFTVNEMSVVDNASAGGMVAPVDTDTGLLGSAVNSDYLNSRRYEYIPDTDCKITGFPIPFWLQTVDMVRQAHKHFLYRLIIGWDLIITDKGPIIVEANSQPGINFIQRAHQVSFSSTKIGTILSKQCLNALQNLYNGKVGDGEHGNGALQLYMNSSLVKFLSTFCIQNSISLSLKIVGSLDIYEYTKWLAKLAKKMNINGWVTYNDDGLMTVVLRGRTVDIEEMIRCCSIGSGRSHVDFVNVYPYTGSVKAGFYVL